MDTTLQDSIAPLPVPAAGVALLRMLANENRPLRLCHLAGAGEITLGKPTTAAGLSQSAVSQHLAMLRQAGMVATRREVWGIHRRLAHFKAAHPLGALKDLHCPE